MLFEFRKSVLIGCELVKEQPVESSNGGAVTMYLQRDLPGAVPKQGVSLRGNGQGGRRVYVDGEGEGRVLEGRGREINIRKVILAEDGWSIAVMSEPEQAPKDSRDLPGHFQSILAWPALPSVPSLSSVIVACGFIHQQYKRRQLCAVGETPGYVLLSFLTY